MNITDMFRIAPKQPAQTVQQGNGNQQVQNTGSGANPAGTNNGNNQGGNPNPNPNDPNAGPKKDTNPLDSFTNLWQNDPAKKVESAPEFKLEGETMDKVVSSMDFTKGFDPAVMTKAQSGDWQSISELIAHSSKQAYRSAMEHGAHLTNGFVNAREGFNEKGFSNKVRGELASNELAGISNASHPVVKAQLQDIAQKFRSANPDATPKEIQEATITYFKEFAAAINQTSGNQQAQNGPQETDWDKFFDGKQEQS